MREQENGNLRLVDRCDPDAVMEGAESRRDKPLSENSVDIGGELNLRILQTMIRFIEDHHGPAELKRIAERASLDVSDLDGRSRWASSGQVQTFLEGARALFDSEEEFFEACSYRIAEAYGPFRFILRAVSPKLVYEQMVKSFGMISRVGRKSIVEVDRTKLIVRYESSIDEGRLLCLGRQAHMAAMPTLWGLPAAKITETSCISNGDEYCEYHLRWYQHSRWVPLLTGLLAGVAAATGLWLAGVSTIPVWALIPLLGGLVGYVFELRRTNKANLKIGDEINDALRELARDDAEARREIVDFHKREREWAQKMEQQVAERTATLQDVLDQVKRMHEEKRSVIHGFSHDLKNPFASVYGNIDYLMSFRERLPLDLREVVEDQALAASRMKQMLEDLVSLASTEAGLIRVKPERMDVPPLVDVLRRRARAFAHDRDIRVSVLSTREAPPTIITDRLVFDRVTDNLLTNATKYTERGSIVVELDGKPGFLTIKVSDTGRGIDPHEIERIFKPEGSDPKRREDGSHGVGLSVVVQLLGQIGGKLEVKSIPGRGTTFWAHFPEVLDEPDKVSGAATVKPRPSAEELIGQVVNIRKSQPP